MNKNTIIKSLRISYFVAIIATLMVPLAFESGFVEKGTLAKVLSSTAIYIIQVVTVMLTVILIPLAIKGFTRTLDKAKDLSEDSFLILFSKKSLQRIFLLFIVLVINGFTYYGIGYDGALYCGLLGLGAMAYSYPTKMVLEHYLHGDKK